VAAVGPGDFFIYQGSSFHADDVAVSTSTGPVSDPGTRQRMAPSAPGGDRLGLLGQAVGLRTDPTVAPERGSRGRFWCLSDWY
jgi:hypothetical protein